jgi:8-oxo-dGTP pyrophosphatase MutT (NUDIX family)
MQTAIRELEEETGVKEFALDESKKFSMFYTFTHEGVRIDKQVDYFLGYCHSTDTVVTQPQEVCELRWCSLDEAMDLLTHQNTRDVLEEVMATLEVSPKKVD